MKKADAIIACLPPAVRVFVCIASKPPRSNLPWLLKAVATAWGISPATLAGQFGQTTSEKFYLELKDLASKYPLASAYPVLNQVRSDRRSGKVAAPRVSRKADWTPRDVVLARDLLRQQEEDRLDDAQPYNRLDNNDSRSRSNDNNQSLGNCTDIQDCINKAVSPDPDELPRSDPRDQSAAPQSSLFGSRLSVTSLDVSLDDLGSPLPHADDRPPQRVSYVGKTASAVNSDNGYDNDDGDGFGNNFLPLDTTQDNHFIDESDNGSDNDVGGGFGNDFLPPDKPQDSRSDRDSPRPHDVVEKPCHSQTSYQTTKMPTKLPHNSLGAPELTPDLFESLSLGTHLDHCTIDTCIQLLIEAVDKQAFIRLTST
ncbi:hypothetical protein EsH8_XIV_000022 [Colletotrichum jinshuiense]